MSGDPKPRAIKFLFIINLILLISCNPAQKWHRTIMILTQRAVDQMTVKEKAGQVLLTYSRLDDLNFIREIKPGGIFIHSLNIPEKNEISDTQNLKIMIHNAKQELLKENALQPFFAIDHEGGPVERIKLQDIHFPAPMGMAQAGTEMIEKQAVVSCRYLKNLGINWIFGPSLDVHSRPENPVIGIRSFSTDPEKVFQDGLAYIKGLNSAGCMSAAKHFPGHGDTIEDSHITLPIVKKNSETLNQTELYPFKKLIETGRLDGLMTAHILFPEQDSLPATLSSHWLHDILRTQWKYTGLIITDDLSMQAVNGYRHETPPQTAIDALTAGADFLLIFAFEPEQLVQIRDKIAQKAMNDNAFNYRLTKAVVKIIYYKIRLGIISKNLLKFNSDAEQLNYLEYTNSRKNQESDLNENLNNIKLLNKRSSEKSIVRFKGDTFPLKNESWNLYTDMCFNDFQCGKLKTKYKFIRIAPLSEISKGTNIVVCHIGNIFNIKPYLTGLTLTSRYKRILITSSDPWSLGKSASDKFDTLITGWYPTGYVRNALKNLCLSGTVPLKYHP